MCPLEKAFFPETRLLAEKRQGASELLSLNSRESQSHCTDFSPLSGKSGGKQHAKGKQKGCYQQGKAFDLKIEIKFEDRKDNLLFMS